MTDTQLHQKQTPQTAEVREHAEGPIARSIEQQTAKLPSDIWLWAAFGSIGAALFLKLNGSKHNSLFVGQWAAPFMLMGVYNKLVKVGGSDRVDRPEPADHGNKR